MENIKLSAKYINIIGNFLSRRDIGALTKDMLLQSYKLERVDLLIIFGGCIPYTYDLVGEAIKEGIAKDIMIVGGAGHTTEALRIAINSKYKEIITQDRMEADIISDYLKLNFNINNPIIEKESTNCGNNVSNSLKLLKREGYIPKSAIIIQDATMQLRMDATFRKVWGEEETLIINFAGYKAKVIVKKNKLRFEDEKMWGMWKLNDYITLLIGEINRLKDTEEGYGPKGKNFIDHVDIPEEVEEAFSYLINYHNIREANENFK